MLTLTTDERLALLLSVLGKDAATAAFKSMNPTRAKFVSSLLDEYNIDPPNSEEIDFIVQDFNNYFAFAMETLGPQIMEAEAANKKLANDKQKSKKANSSDGPKIVYFDPIEPTGQPVEDLNRLQPFQILTAIANDHPKTIAMVLRELNTQLAAEVIQRLPEATQTTTFVFLSQPSTVSDRIVQQVLETTFTKANAVTMHKEEADQSQILAELMRSLPKDLRGKLIEKLGEEDEELVAEVRAKLYIFDDLLRLDDRDTQRVLGEIETDILIVALQRADDSLVTKILSNLSKRARQTIEEEMQYKTGVSDEEVDEARSRLVGALGKLDEAGEITLN